MARASRRRACAARGRRHRLPPGRAHRSRARLRPRRSRRCAAGRRSGRAHPRARRSRKATASLPAQVIARLDTRDAELAIARLRADRAQADAQLRLLLAGSRQEDIRQAEAQVTAAEADISAAESELLNAQADLDRYEALLKANAGSRKARDDAQARRDVARERVAATRQRATATAEGAARVKAGARREEIEAARARVAAVDAQIAAAEKAIADATVTAPAAGSITSKLVNVGEIVAPRAPLAVMTDLDHAWGEVFVDEPLVPRLVLGQSATLYTDAGGAGPAGQGDLHLAQGGVHAAQRADGGGAVAPGLPDQGHGRQQQGRVETRHAGRGGAAAAVRAGASRRGGALAALARGLGSLAGERWGRLHFNSIASPSATAPSRRCPTCRSTSSPARCSG